MTWNRASACSWPNAPDADEQALVECGWPQRIRGESSGSGDIAGSAQFRGFILPGRESRKDWPKIQQPVFMVAFLGGLAAGSGSLMCPVDSVEINSFLDGQS